MVNSDGSEVSQLVDENDRRVARRAAQYQCANNDNVRCDLNGASTNANSIGIEHAGNASQTSFPEGQIDSSARVGVQHHQALEHSPRSPTHSLACAVAAGESNRPGRELAVGVVHREDSRGVWG